MAANAQIVFTPEGKRLYGMDADLYLKEQASRDLEFEGKIMSWIESVLDQGTLPLKEDPWLCLKSGNV